MSPNFSPFRILWSHRVRMPSQTFSAMSWFVRGDALSSRERMGGFCFSAEWTGGLGLLCFFGTGWGESGMAMVVGHFETIWTVPLGRLSGSTTGAACLFFSSTLFSLFFFLASTNSSAVGGQTFIVSKSTVGSPAHNSTEEGLYR